MLVGSVDALISQTFFGWAFDTSEPNINVTLAFFLDGRLVGMTSASGLRRDLAEAGFGTGHFGFSVSLPQTDWNDIEIRASHSGEVLLRRSRKDLELPASDTQNNLALKLPIRWENSDQIKLSRVARSIYSPLGDARAHASRYISDLLQLSGSNQLKKLANFQGGRSPVFMFCPINWEFRLQRYQHFALQLADLGFTVFYIGPGNLRSDLSTAFVVKQLGRARLFELDIYSRAGEVELALPKLEDPEIHQIRASIREAISSIGGLPLVYISFPSWMLFVKDLAVPMIYDIADLHSGFSHVSAEAIRDEEQLIQRAGDVICTTKSLKEISQPLRKDEIKVVPNAASLRFLYPLEPSNNQKIRVGYVGAIDSWFDVELLSEVATNNPQLEFIIAGSGTRAGEISERNIQNIILVGEITHDHVAELIDSFDVCFIPFKSCDLILHTDPVKMYEYMARGKPVISTPFSSPERFGKGVNIIHNSEQFRAALTKADLSEKSAQSRQNFVRNEHTWLHRTRQLERSINRLTSPITCWISHPGADWYLWLIEAASVKRVRKIVLLFDSLLYEEFSHLVPDEIDGVQVRALPSLGSGELYSSLQRADVKMQKFLMKIDAKKVSILEFRKYAIDTLEQNNSA